MKSTKSSEESEQVREALLDLERANRKERDIRIEAEALLTGLKILTDFKNKDQMFINLLGVFRDLVHFDDAFVLVDQGEGPLHTIASTSPKFQSSTWSIADFAQSKSQDRPIAFFDIELVPEWKNQPTESRQGVCSALHITLSNQSQMAFLVCTHSARGFFTERYLRISSRFAPLASQALTTIGYTNELERMNGKLQIEIKERKNAEETAARSQEQVISSSKMAALGEMAGGIAHEINTPLAIIGMRVEQLEESMQNGTYKTEDITETLLVVKSTTDRIAKIVSGLRFFARDGKNAPSQEVSVSTLIEDTLSFCRERFSNHGVQIEVKNSSPELTIECRAVEISQVLLNLFNNAYDAIELLKDRWIRIDVVEKGSFVEISVTDSGSGISKEVQEKMMQPFFTTKNIGKGTGLGLSLSRGIISSHQGKIYFDTTSQNTRFIILFPKQQQDSATLTPIAEAA